MTYNRRAVVAAGDGAANTLRHQIRREGYVTCPKCQFTYLASAMEIDHIVPLSRGGEDVTGNVQAICRTCHRIKTLSDCGYSTTPF